MLKLLLSALVLVVVGCSHKGNPVQYQQTGLVLVSVVVGSLDSVNIYEDSSLVKCLLNVTITSDEVFLIKPNCGILIEARAFSHDFYGKLIYKDEHMVAISDTTWRL
jgi:hypothetical protein